MKLNIVLIIIIILIIINVINCCSLSKNIWTCEEGNKIIFLADDTTDEFLFSKPNNLNFNVSSYNKKPILIDQYDEEDGIRYTFTPEIIDIERVPTKGGQVSMRGYFFLDDRKSVKNLQDQQLKAIQVTQNWNDSRTDLENKYQSYKVLLPSGCKPFPLYQFNGDHTSILKWVHYQPPTILKPIEFDEQGNILIIGENFSNLKSCISIKISTMVKNSTTSIPTSSGNDNETILYDFNKISFPLRDAKEYCGQWNISIVIGEQNVSVPMINNVPRIKGNPDTIPRTGGVITLYGDFLKSKSANAISITIGKDKQCKNIKYPNDDKKTLTCEMPSGNGGGYPLILIVDGFQCMDKIEFSYNQPTIKSISIAQHDTDYTNYPYRVYINGIYFTCSNETLLLVKFHNSILKKSSFKYVTPITIYNDTTLLVDIPSWGLPGIVSMDVVNKLNVSQVILKSNDFIDDSSLFWKPIITSISNCPTVGGIITFSGSHLHSLFYNGTNIPMTIQGGINCISNELYNGDGSFITCKINAGVGSNHQFKIKTIYDTIELPFSYSPPIISELRQVNDKLFLIGSNFGGSPKQLKVSFLNELFNPISITSNHSMAVLQIPLKIEKSSDFKIMVGNQQTNYSSIFQIRPVINSINSLPTSGGIVTINGYFLILSTTSTIKIGSLNCYNGTSNIMETQFTCYLPGKLSLLLIDDLKYISNNNEISSGINHSINFIDSNKQVLPINNENIKFSFKSPTIINSTSVSEEGGLIYIGGYSFNNINLMVKIGNKTCKNPYAETFNFLSCYIPPFTPIRSDNNTLLINITVDGQSTLNLIFNYNFTKAINFEKKVENGIKSYIKWLIPTIIIGVLVIVLTVVYTVYMIKRQRKLKKIKEIMNPKMHVLSPSIHTQQNTTQIQPITFTE